MAENEQSSSENPAVDGAAEPQREVRASRLLACDMLLQDGSVIRIRVRNISSGGLGARADDPVDPWQTVEVRLPGIGAVAGKVAWVRQAQFGVQFETPIDPAKAMVSLSQAQSGHVVPSAYAAPATDYRRPGLRTR